MAAAVAPPPRHGGANFQSDRRLVIDGNYRDIVGWSFDGRSAVGPNRQISAVISAAVGSLTKRRWIVTDGRRRRPISIYWAIGSGLKIETSLMATWNQTIQMIMRKLEVAEPRISAGSPSILLDGYCGLVGADIWRHISLALYIESGLSAAK